MFVLALVWPCAIRALFFSYGPASGQLGPRPLSGRSGPGAVPRPSPFRFPCPPTTEMEVYYVKNQFAGILPVLS